MRNTGSLKFDLYYPGKKTLNEPVISINRRGFSFNKFSKQYFWKKPYAMLYYCKDKKIIAIEPYHLDTEYTLHVNRLKPGPNNPTIDCQRFLIEHDIIARLRLGIDGKKSERFMAEWDEKNLCFMIHLKDGVGRK